jgi:hypothetical protein
MSDPWPPVPPEAPSSPRPSPSEAPGASTAGASPAPSEGTDDRPSPARRAAAIAILVVATVIVLGALVVGKAGAPGSPTFPPAGATTAPAGAAAGATRSVVETALVAKGLQVEVSQTPYRPAEAARLATAPRLVIRAILPTDPDHGRIVIYEFLTPDAASSAAGEQAAYLASGVGRVQFPPDTRFTLRVVGSTVVFFAWSPGSSPDPGTGQISDALSTLGIEVPIPN